MCEVEIKLNTIEDVKNLVSYVTGFECDFEIISGRFVVDAKSIMGIFSLDLSKELKLVIRSDDEFEVDRIKNKIKRFIA
ncbi:HPr family phosphocarrier protein [Ruminococcus bicirculans (ex Wegman et al. 2014)]|uniref:HPr family phosphocarrier protein n=1 Tax=Ruminococcus bicirculans (ex Wegman et al. 2014) TaxID=1160721 RepID=UPI0025E6CAC6|nr:HPr family phosphocarrier protein [uncultured Ruminococcus sp.]